MSVDVKQYRKKPVVVEAVRVTRDNIDELFTSGWLDALGFPESGDLTTNDGFINTLEGEMRVRPGDYIIRGVQGERYPCKPDIFAQTYEEADQ